MVGVLPSTRPSLDVVRMSCVRCVADSVLRVGGGAGYTDTVDIGASGRRAGRAWSAVVFRGGGQGGVTIRAIYRGRGVVGLGVMHEERRLPGWFAARDGRWVTAGMTSADPAGSSTRG